MPSSLKNACASLVSISMVGAPIDTNIAGCGCAISASGSSCSVSALPCACSSASATLSAASMLIGARAPGSRMFSRLMEPTPSSSANFTFEAPPSRLGGCDSCSSSPSLGEPLSTPPYSPEGSGSRESSSSSLPLPLPSFLEVMKLPIFLNIVPVGPKGHLSPPYQSTAICYTLIEAPCTQPGWIQKGRGCVASFAFQPQPPR
mmetsp:Transcript_718/g.1752  ORF Transcript_718/g.1752 Transcript_718/m.1752 type:complete len:203 (-) Transcript_718:140-748(-)